MADERSPEWFADLNYEFSLPDFRVNTVTLWVNSGFADEYKLTLVSATPIDLRGWQESYEGLLTLHKDRGSMEVTAGAVGELTRTDLLLELDRLRGAGYRILTATAGFVTEAVAKRWDEPAPFDASTFFDLF